MSSFLFSVRPQRVETASMIHLEVWKLPTPSRNAFVQLRIVYILIYLGNHPAHAEMSFFVLPFPDPFLVVMVWYHASMQCNDYSSLPFQYTLRRQYNFPSRTKFQRCIYTVVVMLLFLKRSFIIFLTSLHSDGFLGNILFRDYVVYTRINFPKVVPHH